MKIIKCYIENFGKLSNQEFNFSDGLNTLVEDNGYGKTTLATFIKAMFYGLPSTTKKSLEENERKKYNPWQGGNYGGYLEFQVGEGKYKVERFFGKKDSEDVFNIIDLKTGKKTIKYSKNLGEELFGLDAESYERCTFIPQKEIESGINDKISSKLIGMVQGTASKDSFENAIEIIKGRSTELKKRGNAGKIAEVEAEIAEISEEIDGLKKSLDAVDQLQKSLMEEDLLIASLEEEKQKISKKISKYGKYQEMLANGKLIDQKKQEKIKIEENIKRYEAFMNGRDVSLETVNAISLKNDELTSLKAKEKAILETSANKKRFEELASLFSGKNVTSLEIESVIKKEEKARELKNEIDFLRKSYEEKNCSKNTKYFNILFIPLFCLLTFVGVGIFTIQNLIVSIIMFSLAMLSLVTCILILANNIGANKRKTDNNLNDYIKEKEKLYNQLISEINNFVSSFERVEYASLVSFLYDLLSKNKEFYALSAEMQKNTELLLTLKQSINDVKEDINSFFKLFNVEVGVESNLEVLEKIKLTLISLNQNKEMLKNINKALEDFGSNDEKLKDEDLVNMDISELQNQEKEMQKQIDLHRDKKNELSRKIDSIKNMIIDLDELENHLEEKKGLRNELKNEYSILSLTNKFLTQANDNLTAKYKKPMQESLNKYLKIVLDKEYYEFDLDTDLNVSFEKFGQTRGVDYLSKGYKGVVDLCIRFALVDALFEKEKPFIVLDDPFVNFDKGKIKNSVNLIKNISKEYQLIYFVCHESRV